MSIQLITPNTKQPEPREKNKRGYLYNKYEDPCLNISEMFYDSIQGEGVNIGYPSAFIRLQGCTLDCVYCDTKKIRDIGHQFFIEDLFDWIEYADKNKEGFIQGSMLTQLFRDQHLVITGGSPLKQQSGLIAFIQEFIKRYQFKPYIEIENECVLMPEMELITLVNCWSNSPKLANSENSPMARYNQAVIRRMGVLNNSWFKFVIIHEEDWFEIEKDFITPGHIPRSRILLMPQGKNRMELIKNSEMVVKLACRENVRYSPREHIMLWDDEIGK